ncbi:MAG: phosphatidate cytidylyltransferase [Chitinophagaceae bacterium]|nr:phosphatidate cytidylyltransferase [Chitinophagaceae bacterium]
MAFNWQTFRTRAFTAIVFVAVMLTGLLWNHWSFLVLFSIIHFGCWWEYLKLTEKIQQTIFHPYTKLGFMVMGYGLLLWFCRSAYKLSGYGLKESFSFSVSAAGFALLLLGIFQKQPVKLKAFGTAALGFLYISLSWGLMMNLRTSDLIVINTEGGEYFGRDKGFYIPLLIILSIWINDTMAYIVGSLIGKTPLSKISPKKTWEGTIGGITLSVAVISFFLQPLLFWKYLIGISLIASIAGTFGDLLESKLKRMAGVKDSGHLMPGHGGFLDRFDSLLLATPFVWLYVQFFM